LNFNLFLIILTFVRITSLDAAENQSLTHSSHARESYLWPKLTAKERGE
jgi:hypothetical protein